MKPLQSLLSRRKSASARPMATAREGPEEEALRGRWSEPHPDGGTRREAALRQLEERREGGGGGEPLDLRGLFLVDADLSGLNLAGSDLSGADLSRADLEGAMLLRARMEGTTLFQARLERAELGGAELTGANLQGARASGAGFGRARLEGACLADADLSNATLTEASLRGAELRVCRLEGARARSADLRETDLSRADLRGADLEDCRLEGAVLDGARMGGVSLRGITGYPKASWIGVDIRETDFTGAYLCRRHILDQNYLLEFRQQGAWARWLYAAWWLTSDCGRSLVRWAVLTVVLAVGFAGLYNLVGMDWGENETPLSPLYFSVVTLTTLGYGDVLPATLAAQVVAMAEVVTGYVMLGGLLSIFSCKMSRRAE